MNKNLDHPDKEKLYKALFNRELYKSLLLEVIANNLLGVINIVNQGVKISFPDVYLLKITIDKRYNELFKYLLDQIIIYDSKLTNSIINNSIIYCSTANNLEILKYLLTKETKFKTLDESLSKAAAYGYLDIIKTLINYGAKFHLNDEPLKKAIINKHSDVAIYLLEKYMISHQDHIFKIKNYMANLAASHNELKTLEYILNKDVHIKAINKALISASDNGHLEAIKLLIKYGANVNEKNNSAFIASLLKKHIEVSKYFITEHNQSIEVAIGFMTTSKELKEWAIEYRNAKTLKHNLNQQLIKKSSIKNVIKI